MKPEQQRIAIAEACGWTRVHFYEGKCYGLVPNAEEFDSQGALENYFEVPDYLDDLDAMHEAEKVLRKGIIKLWQSYVDKLNETLSMDDAVHATASQRAEAFLRTLNLWKE